MIDLRKFVVASTAEEAELHLSVWNRHREVRSSFDERVFDDKGEALKTCALLVQRAKDESPFGCPVPCDEHSRCVGFNPQVWRVQISVKQVTAD